MLFPAMPIPMPATLGDVSGFRADLLFVLVDLCALLSCFVKEFLRALPIGGKTLLEFRLTAETPSESPSITNRVSCVWYLPVCKLYYCERMNNNETSFIVFISTPTQ